MQLDSQVHWQEGEIFANGIRQHYYRTGQEKPPLLLLHGFTENGLCWSRVARGLEQDYDVIMLDARGHGLSDGPQTGYTQEILTRDVAECIQELGLQQLYVLGFSNGALTAAQVAALLPEHMRAVALEDPPWSESPRRRPTSEDGEPWPGYRTWLNAWLDWHRALRTQNFEERLASSSNFLMPGMLDWPEEDLRTHLEAQAQFNLDVLNHVPPMPSPSPWRATVESITCPILLLTSDPARGAIQPQELQQIAATWRRGQLVTFPEASHFIHHEKRGDDFANFLALIKTFFQGA